MAAAALVISAASTALAIESFQERFEWGDLSKPTTLQGRVIVLDHYDEAVWINVSVFGGAAESGFFWQKIHPGKTLKFYADKGAWEELKKMGRPHAGPAAAKEVPPSSTTDLIEFSRDRAGAESSCHFLDQEDSGSGRFHGEAAEHLRSSIEGVRGKERN